MLVGLLGTWGRGGALVDLTDDQGGNLHEKGVGVVWTFRRPGTANPSYDFGCCEAGINKCPMLYSNVLGVGCLLRLPTANTEHHQVLFQTICIV